ncbi:MAG TPA: hypothetical protein VK131_08660, partial [Candidatus Acidoferrales bacterium]|nr:hypothetical protein [Candidatus Acidoferrales bacterium]
MPGRPFQAEDIYQFRWIDHVRLSPAGDRVAYHVTWADQETRQNRSYVWVRGLGEADEPIQATAGPRRDQSPEWSPDGTRLAFLSKRGPRPQLFVADLGGGDARQLS